MLKTKIDWCDSTWSPVTGCYHDCPYCYAKRIAARFGEFMRIDGADIKVIGNKDGEICVELAYKTANPYPEKFTPTFHKYKLDEYQNKKGRNIFVCSMADLFGEWVPDSWIAEIFAACEKAPQHNYLFLTKNPKRYIEMEKYKKLPWVDNFWFGTTVTTKKDLYENGFDLCNAKFINEGKTQKNFNSFLSAEPLLERIDFSKFDMGMVDWLIIGAETGRRKDKVIPKREWIEGIVNECRKSDIPVFMKSSLADIWGEPLIQEFPEGLKKSRG